MRFTARMSRGMFVLVLALALVAGLSLTKSSSSATASPASTVSTAISPPAFAEGAGCYIKSVGPSGANLKLEACAELPTPTMGPVLVRGLGRVYIDPNAAYVTSARLVVKGYAKSSPSGPWILRCRASKNVTTAINSHQTSVSKKCPGFDPGHDTDFKVVSRLYLGGVLAKKTTASFINE